MYLSKEKERGPHKCGGAHGGFFLKYNMTLRDKLICYIYNKTNNLEAEKESILQQRRYQAMDSLDMYENMRAEIRISAWNEFLQDLFRLVIGTKDR